MGIDDWRLPPLRAGQPPSPDLEARRAGMSALVARSEPLHPERPHIPRREIELGGVPCHEVGDPDAGTVVLYLHGGGFMLGHPSYWVRYAARLAEQSGARFVLARYRLAPEHPFPAGLHDAISAYLAILAEGRAKRIVVMGESAGANLSAALIAAGIRSGQERLPDAAILLSPLLDLTLASDSYESHAALDPMVSRASCELIAAAYLQGHAPDDPLASPNFGDLARFPPTLYLCGGHEVLIGDALDFVGRLARANRPVEAMFVEGAGHGWTFVDPDSPGSRRSLDRIVAYLRAL
jgi:epsilon-lactone hydrolase